MPKPDKVNVETGDLTGALSPIEEIIADARSGRMFVLVDDEDRENEGDLIIPAEKITPDAINFMATHGRGLICLAMTAQRVRELGLKPMDRRYGSRFDTAFTVSIEAREGVTTGISAHDRARTVRVAIDPQSTAADIATPGHIFPIAARDGGVLSRAGHTEAAVDIARLAGLTPAGVICEILNDDGTMARLPDLVGFCAKHGLKIATIADLIASRRRTEQIVSRVVEHAFDSRYGGQFRMIVYANLAEYAEHIALVKGDLEGDEPVIVRVHALDVMTDVLGDREDAGLSDLHAAMQAIGAHGRGVLVLIREPRETTLSESVRIRMGHVAKPPAWRDYGIGAQILRDLGVRRMILLSNTPRAYPGLDGFGLEIVGYEPVSHDLGGERA